jgi:thiamine-monophosphate kinase
MNLSQIGEKQFLKEILPLLNISHNFINGFGHDISILDLGLEKYISFKIDRAAKPIAITNSWTNDWSIWGKLGVIANLSDHAAAGSTPKAAMLSIITPKETNIENVKQIIKGCEQACLENNVSFVGGDTKEGGETQVVVSTIGITNFNSKILPASPYQELYISGQLGGFMAANIIMRNQSKFSNKQVRNATNLLLSPKAQIKNSQYLYNNSLVYSATDLSDGLVDALSSFCKNNSGFQLLIKKDYFHELAILVNKVMGTSLLKLALSAGDWAIAFIPNKNINHHINNLENLNYLGSFNTSNKLTVIQENGEILDIPLIINEQFRQRLEDQKAYLNEFE